MIGLLIAIILFNIIGFKTNKKLSGNQILHIWMFTIAFQTLFDTFIDYKYHGYWYFDHEPNWRGILPHTILIPPVNIFFLNWYPHKGKFIQKLVFIIIFEIFMLIYEYLTLLPEPWGYFHYGWWEIWHAAIVNPILLLILLGYYRWVCILENKALLRKV
ncbi:hypothetical protein [Neobacillus sp. FSL H8-0543]|uniref:hypothetical protein n=1 Tax=Neobacillus sp. FSL H8-0543 TaxID=2954672 RepID=UPI003158FCBA